jgi:ferredoxin-NADP reductase
MGLNGPIYYIAGPSGMVTAMTGLLHSSGVSDDDIRTEEFGDYTSPGQERIKNQQCGGNEQKGRL